MRSIKFLTAVGLTVLFAAAYCFEQLEIQNTIKTSIIQCGTVIIPSLFPFLVLSNLWIDAGCNKMIERIVNSFLPGPKYTLSTMLIGVLGGYPLGANTVVKQYQIGYLPKNEAQRQLIFCNNAGPAFILFFMSNLLFGTKSIGLIIWMIHIIAALILLRLFQTTDQAIFKEEKNTIEMSIPQALTSSIKKAGYTVIEICFYIIFFTMLLKSIGRYICSDKVKIILAGFMELSSGVINLNRSDIPEDTRFLLSSLFLAWGGTCVHAQSISSILQTDLSPTPYLLGKAMHVSIVGLITCIIIKIYKLYTGAPIKNNLDILFIIFAALLLFVYRKLQKSSTGKTALNSI